MNPPHCTAPFLGSLPFTRAESVASNCRRINRCTENSGTLNPRLCGKTETLHSPWCQRLWAVEASTDRKMKRVLLRGENMDPWTWEDPKDKGVESPLVSHTSFCIKQTQEEVSFSHWAEGLAPGEVRAAVKSWQRITLFRHVCEEIVISMFLMSTAKSRMGL